MREQIINLFLSDANLQMKNQVNQIIREHLREPEIQIRSMHQIIPYNNIIEQPNIINLEVVMHHTIYHLTQRNLIIRISQIFLITLTIIFHKLTHFAHDKRASRHLEKSCSSTGLWALKESLCLCPQFKTIWHWAGRHLKSRTPVSARRVSRLSFRRIAMYIA